MKNISIKFPALCVAIITAAFFISPRAGYIVAMCMLFFGIGFMAAAFVLRMMERGNNEDR